MLDQPRLRHGAGILSMRPPDRAARLLDQMSADGVADIVREMRVSVRNNVLVLVTARTKSALESLLPYPEDCAGAIMTTEFVTVPSDWTVEQVLARVRAVEHTRETVYAIYVLDPRGGALLAGVPLRLLIGADPNRNRVSALHCNTRRCDRDRDLLHGRKCRPARDAIIGRSSPEHHRACISVRIK